MASESVAGNPRDGRNSDYAVTTDVAAQETDQPILTTPQSVEVIHRAVLQDQIALKFTNALKTGGSSRASTNG